MHLGNDIYIHSLSGIINKINKYISSEKLNLYGWVENGEVLGVCGFEILGDKIEIDLIAVAENVQKSGVGGKILVALQSKYHLPIVAETDDDAVGFYRKIGFTTTEFLHPRWNVTRYKCVLYTKNTFNNIGLKKLVDDIPIEREYAIRIFEKVGFKRVKIENLGEVMALTNSNLTYHV